MIGCVSLSAVDGGLILFLLPTSPIWMVRPIPASLQVARLAQGSRGVSAMRFKVPTAR
jgi:hypothetical protein